MKTKLEMAMQMIVAEVRRVGITSIDNDKVIDAWNLADAMQAEADKREKEEQDKLKQNERNHHDELVFIGLEEWQPDWSQAPDVATYWTMRQDGECLWWKGKPLFDGSCFYDAVGICHTVGYAPSFGYTGDWRNSLRKRPE